MLPINALPKTSRNRRWINQTDLLFTRFASLWHHQLNNVTRFIYFSVVFSVQRFLNVKKSLGDHTKNSVTFFQMPLGTFMWIWTSNTCVKFHVKIPSGCLENDKQQIGDTFFAAHCIYQATNFLNAPRITAMRTINNKTALIQFHSISIFGSISKINGSQHSYFGPPDITGHVSALQNSQRTP